jgi:hypothetical protein
VTRRDFELLAEVIAASGSRFTGHQAHAGFAADMADALVWTNQRFDRVRFVRACRPSWVAGTRAEAVWDRAELPGGDTRRGRL